MKYRRQSIRLKDYSYALKGLYYVTICTQNRELYFENNDIKNLIRKYWLEIPEHFKNVELDEWVIMPNHLHGIIIINKCRGAVSAPNNEEGGETPPLQPKSQPKPTLGQIIGYFKYKSTKQINEFLGNEPGQKLWQRNYYEHIIRNEESLNKIRKYIKFNPIIWDRDRNNPKNWKKLLNNEKNIIRQRSDCSRGSGSRGGFCFYLSRHASFRNRSYF